MIKLSISLSDSDSDLPENPKKKETATRNRRSVTSSSSKPKKIMELMVVADKTMIESHNKDFLLAYLLAQTNIVSDGEIFTWV